jgi:CPA2 family monovalent cation:H+ antiporter-2
LFSIGLELTGDQVRRMGGLLLGGGSIQVGLTVAVITVIGLAFDVPVKVGVYSGCLVALSSTAIVLKLLSERGETGSPTGDVAVAFLIFQDIAVVLMVLVVPMLGDGGGGVGEIVEATLKSLVLIVGVLIATKYVVPPLLSTVSRHANNEEFLLAVLAIAMGVGYLVTLLDLSASLGAFIAGLVVSSGPHRERATQYVMPFQILFSAVFFASIGMLLDPDFLLDELGKVLLFAGLIVVIKVVTTGVAARVLRTSWPIVASSALLLAQLGEFSFVLERAGRDVGLTPFDRADGAQTFIASSVLLFALTPALFKAGQVLKVRLEARFEPPPGETPGSDAVVIVGSAERTPRLVQIIEAERPGVPIVVADTSAVGAGRAASDDDRPAVALLVIDNFFGHLADGALERASSAKPPIPVIVRAPTSLDVDHLRDMDGVRLIVDETEADGAFINAVLTTLGPGRNNTDPDTGDTHE